MPSGRLPMPHQVDFLRWAKARRGVGVFLQMRLGKSYCTTRWLQTRPGVDRVLIVSPLAVLRTWRKELALEGHEPVVVTGTQAQKMAAVEAAGSGARWYLTNKESLLELAGRAGKKRAKSSWLAQLPWDAVVLDESTCIRNPRAKISSTVVSELSRVPFRAALSGLPNPEGPEDFIQQMMFVRGGDFMGHRSFWSWRQEFMVPSAFGWVTKAGTDGAVREAVREDGYFLTRKEAGLPDTKVRSVRHVQVPAKVRAAIRDAQREFQVGDKMTSNKLATLTWMGQLAGGRWPHDPELQHDAKLDELEYLLRGELHNQQVVVWARYTAELLAVVERVAKRVTTSVALVNGDVEQRWRDRLVEQFQRGSLKVLVAQPKCLQMGVDLSNAAASIIMSNYYDFEIRSQLEDRLVHPRRTEPALIIDVVAEGTVDEDAVDALSDKEQTARSYTRKFMELASKRAEEARRGE